MKVPRTFWFILALAAGAALRLLWPADMEWKEDEYYNYIVPHLIATGERAWPWVGMNSGVYIANPGMSIWTFAVAAKLALWCGGADPLALSIAVRLIAWAGCALVWPFAYFGLRKSGEDREPWLWAFAFSMVNPFLIYFHRKLWPQAFMPLFSMVALGGWFRRDRAAGAFIWGLAGALLGQVHMAGFFSALALVLFTAYTTFKKTHGPTRWGAWGVGSVVGALPLIPWFSYLVAHPTGQPLSANPFDALQLKFWVFWVTDAVGLHLGNPLGLHLGGSVWAQISDFARYPLWNGRATYLLGIAHWVALLTGLAILASGLLRQRSARATETVVLERSMLWGFGALLTATLVNIRRYYMAASFPLQWVWLARLAGRTPRGRSALLVLWFCQLLISMGFVYYVHVHQGSLQGDYGEAYRVVQSRHFQENGERWPDLKLLH